MELQAREELAPGGDRYVDVKEAAAVLGLSVDYLNQLRVRGGGCRFSTFGRAVRYRLSDLYAWAESKTATSTSAREVA
jgi:excisionase family DNA binding protein